MHCTLSDKSSCMSLLTRHGYIIDSEDFTDEYNEELIVIANKGPYYNNDVQPFAVYEDRYDGTVAVPRFWGEEHFGRTQESFGYVQKANRLVFKGEMRPGVQQEAADKTIEQLHNHGGGVLSLPTGFGKCHGIDTPILMYDGSIKMVQNVKQGDLLMGDDSKPRKVLSLASGTDEMYDIIPVKGDKYTVNQEHILVLKNTQKNPWIQKRVVKEVEVYDVQWWEDLKVNSIVNHTKESAELFLELIRNRHQDTIEISVKDYIKKNKTFKHCFKGYRASVDFAEKDLPIDPYMIGIWLGDGTSGASAITTQDDIIIEYFMCNLGQYGLYLTKRTDKYGYGISCIDRINKFWKTIIELNMKNNKHIPMIYKCNSRENRLLLLAGLLDSDGSLVDDGVTFDFIQKSEKLIDDVIYLCRSLGFACYKSKQYKGCWYKGVYSEGSYYRICISGNGIEDIPTLLPHKKAKKRTQIKNPLVTGIKVEYVGIGEFYGFTIDGNGRYMLGDFTVTHNTALALYVASVMKVKTLVVVHKQFLTDQWENRIETFVPFAKIGRLQRDMEDVHDCDIVVGMLQSIAMREYDEDLLQDFGLVIFDEVHVVPAPVFSRALLRLCAPYMLGLSATPVRKDGLSKVINWFLGPIFYEHSLSGKSDVTVEIVKCRLGRTLPMNIVAAINILCNMKHRNTLILKKAQYLVSLGHKVMIISERRSHCEALRNELASVDIDGGLCYGGINNFELEISKEKAVLLGTYSYVKEGFDLPTLDAMILATPRSDVVQACGRILRFQTSLSPTIIDIVDEWIIGRAQSNKRRVYYEKSGFTLL